jgi:hypothetical protein
MSNDTTRMIDAVRRIIRVRDRTLLVSTITYSCDCGMGRRVALAKGVVAPDARVVSGEEIPAPREIPCSGGAYDMGCDGMATYDVGSFEKRVSGLTTSEAYLRVPSRRAGGRLGHAGRFEAQLVEPEERGWQ